MHTVLKQHLHCALQVTASHNPAIYNGIKLIVEEGRDAPVETTQRIEALANGTALDTRFVPFAVGEANGSIQYVKNPFNDFLDDILARINGQAIRDRGLRILFDSMHGSGTYALMVILHTVRCTVDVIHTERDAYFGGIAPAPSEHSLGELSEKVVDGGYDLGIALDGDGDRLGIIDSSGRYIAANEILVMLYYYLHEYKGWKGPVVRNMSTTHMLDAVANALGEACYEVPVGFKWISAKIDEVDAVLGGESSGGLTVRGHIHGKDSAYAAALFVEMVSAMNASPARIMADLTARFGAFEMADSDFSYPAEQKPQLTHLLFEQKALPAFDRPVRRVSYEDGCKVYFEDGGFVVCRFSGTEPLLRRGRYKGKGSGQHPGLQGHAEAVSRPMQKQTGAMNRSGLFLHEILLPEHPAPLPLGILDASHLIDILAEEQRHIDQRGNGRAANLCRACDDGNQEVQQVDRRQPLGLDWDAEEQHELHIGVQRRKGDEQ